MRYVHGADGNVVASIDSSGHVTLGLEPGRTVGIVRANTDVYGDEAGAEWLGRIDADGRIANARYEVVGNVDVNGRVFDVTGRLLGKVDKPVDGAVLLLLVGSLTPEVIAGNEPPAESLSTMMDEVISLADERAGPGIRRDAKPLTDADVFGAPYKKPGGR